MERCLTFHYCMHQDGFTLLFILLVVDKLVHMQSQTQAIQFVKPDHWLHT